jgi:hypothetical protein
MGSVGAVLATDDAVGAWLTRSGPAEPADATSASLVALPDPLEAPELLLDLAVPHQAINELLAVLAAVRADDTASELVERCARTLVRGMGVPSGRFGLPVLSASSVTALGPVGRLFPVLVYLAAVPSTRAYHQRRGISADVSRRTLADLGRQLAVHQRRYGTAGLAHPSWPSLHVRGLLYQLGRLQFERARLGDSTGRAILAAGSPYGPGMPSLELHIPDFSGSLTPAACDRSVAMAVAFFRAHFAEERYRVAACHSWLFDPVLRQYLPPDSNIIRFQDRFRPGYTNAEPADENIIGFVFGDPALPVGELPTDSTLRRAVADHLRSGGHWTGGCGWFEWPEG